MIVYHLDIFNWNFSFTLNLLPLNKSLYIQALMWTDKPAIIKSEHTF